MLIFNSKIEKPKYLEDLLVGRKDVVNALEKSIITSAKSGHNIEHLLIGNRGCGKTHLLRVLYNRIIINEIVSDKMHIAYMAEEEIGIDSFFSLLVRIIEAIIRWSDNNEDKSELRSKIDLLKEISASDREDRVQEFLLSFLGEKQLLILAENVNEIFVGMKSKGQARFRDFIQRTDKINIIATSQALFTDIQNEDKPFHNFFHIIQLKRLNENETKDLLYKMAAIENEAKLLTHFSTSKGKGQVMAIHFLSEGNHRLIALFFEFLKTDIKSNLTEPFLQTLDKLKPYYESFIRHLPPQQQKIIQYLAIKHQPQLGSIIAKECFLTPGGTSKQMNELMNKGFVDTHRIGRDNKYELTEPMMRYCIELTNNRDGIIGMFARFIAILYSDTEIINKYLTLKYQLNNNCKVDYTYKQEEELSIYKKASEDHTQDFQHIENVIEQIKDKCTKSAIVKIMMDIHNTYSKCPISDENCECSRFLNRKTSENSIFKIFIAKLILYSFYDEAYNLVCYMNSNPDYNEENITAPIFFVKCLYKSKAPKKTINYFLNKLMDLDTDILTNKLIFVLHESQFVGNKQAIYELTKDERALLEFIDDKATIVSLPNEMLDIRTETSNIEKDKLFQQLLSKDPKNAENYLSYAYFLSSQNENETAEDYIHKALKLEPNNAEIKYNYSNFLYSVKEDVESSLKFLKEAIKINSKPEKYWIVYAERVGELNETEANLIYEKMEVLFPDSAKVFNNYGKFLSENSKINLAIEKLKKSIELDKEYVEAYETLGDLYTKKNEFKKSIKFYSMGLKIEEFNFDILTRRGLAYFENKNYKAAFKDFEKVTSSLDEETIKMGIEEEIDVILLSVFNLYLLGIINNNTHSISMSDKYLGNSKLSNEANWAFALIKYIYELINDSGTQKSINDVIDRLNKIYDTQKVNYKFSLFEQWIKSCDSKIMTNEKRDHIISLFVTIEKLQGNSLIHTE